MKPSGRFIFLSFLFSFVILLSCKQEQEVEKRRAQEGLRPEERIRVITTIAPLYSFTKSVAGDRAHVENLLPSGSGPHEYSLSPEDVIRITKARVVIKNGAGLENWLDKVLGDGTERNRQLIVDSSSGVNIISRDPHIWLSPKNAVIQVKNIRDALMKADPGSAGHYAENAAAYITRLENLDREITQTISLLKRKDFLPLHSAFLYFAKDYGLRQAAVIQESPEKEPTPQHIRDVIAAIKKNRIRVIFSEPGAPHKIVETLAKDLDLQVSSLDTLETGSLYSEWYEERMRANLEALKTAMNQQP